MNITDELRKHVRHHITTYLASPSCTFTEDDLALQIGCSSAAFLNWITNGTSKAAEKAEVMIIAWAWFKFPGLQKKLPELGKTKELVAIHSRQQALLHEQVRPKGQRRKSCKPQSKPHSKFKKPSPTFMKWFFSD